MKEKRVYDDYNKRFGLSSNAKKALLRKEKRKLRAMIKRACSRAALGDAGDL